MPPRRVFQELGNRPIGTNRGTLPRRPPPVDRHIDRWLRRNEAALRAQLAGIAARNQALRAAGQTANTAITIDDSPPNTPAPAAAVRPLARSPSPPPRLPIYEPENVRPSSRAPTPNSPAQPKRSKSKSKGTKSTAYKNLMR